MSDFINEKYNIPSAGTKPWEAINLAMDIGSTQTRSAVFTKDLKIGAPLIIDSNYEVFNRDLDYIESPDSSLYANLEMIISDLTAEQKVRPQLTVEHVVKGSLLSAITNMRQITVAATSKVNQKATYINAVSNVAVMLLQQMQENGMSSQSVTVNMVISLPPEDTKNKNTLDVFRSSLAGHYRVEFCRLGVTVEFIIPEEMTIISEPEAVAVYQSVENGLEDAEDSVVCILDIGGRSTGITFIVNKHLKKDGCATVNLGGSILTAIFSRELASAYNIQEPIIPIVMRSMETGVFKIGAQKFDVTEQLNAAKSEFASQIFNELLRAVDINGIQLQNISTVFCSGRTFGEAPKSPSLMTYIEKMYNEKSAYTNFVRINSSNPILSGLCYKGILSAQD